MASESPENPMGRKVVISTAVWSPLTNPCAVEGAGTLDKTAACPEPGLSNEIIGHLLRMSNIDYEVVPLRGKVLWGGLVEGGGPCDFQPGSVLANILNGTYDTLSAEWVVTEERAACFDFAVPTVYTNNVLVYKGVQDPSQNLLALVRVYTPGIWAITAFTILLLTVFFTVTMRVFSVEPEEKGRSLHSIASESFWTIVQFSTDQASTIPATFALQTSTARHLLSFLGVFAIFFLKLYESGLLTQILMPTEVRPFRDLSELTKLVHAGEAQYIVERSTNYEEYLEDERITAMDGMRAADKHNPVLRANSPTNGLEMVRQGDAGALGYMVNEVPVRKALEEDCFLRFHYDYDLPKPRMAFVYAKVPVRKALEEDCFLRFHYDYDLPKPRMAFVYAKGKNAKLRQLLDANINSAISHTGFLNRKYYGGQKRACPPPDARLKASNLIGIFMLSAIIIGCAFVAFGLERMKCFNKLRRRDSETDLDVQLDVKAQASDGNKGMYAGYRPGSEDPFVLRKRQGWAPGNCPSCNDALHCPSCTVQHLN